MVAPTWHVEGHGTMCDEASAQVVGKQGADLTSQGEGALYLSQATLQPASNHRYVTRSFTCKLCPSTSGWPPEVFSGKLEPYYRRPLGVGDYYGLQNRISFSAPPGNLAPHFHVKSSARICPGGGRQDDPSRSHPPSHLQHRRGVCQQYISGRQKRRRSSPCYQFKESEFLCGLPTFQNGGNPHVAGPSKKRRFYGKTGPQRCILYCPSLDRALKVLKIPLEGNSLGICMPPLRAGQCSPNIHKNHETCGGNTAEFRDSLDYISRRSSNLSRLGADCQTPSGNCSNSPRELGFRHKSQEVSVVPSTENRVSRYDCGFVNPLPCPSQGQSQGYSQGVREFDCKSHDNSTPISTSHRSSELLHSSSVPCPTVLPLPTTDKDSGTQIGRPLRVSSSFESGSYRGTAMVGREPNGLEWEGASSTRPQHRNRERCLEGRQGCTLQWTEHRRPVESVRAVSPHKLPGTAGRVFCNKMLCKRQDQHSHSAFHGQCDSSYLHQQDGGNKIPCPSLFVSRPLAMVPTEADNSFCCTHSRNSECECRQGVSVSPGLLRLETLPRSVPSPSEQVGSSRYRPVRILPDKPAASLCELEAGPSIRSSGCLLPPVEQGQGLCLSPILPFRQVPQSSSETAGTTASPCSTSVENPTLVSSFIGPSYRPSSPSSPNPQSVNAGRNDSPTNPPPAGRMAYLRQQYEEGGFSVQARDLLSAAWRRNTSDQYASAWRKWTSWCAERKVNPISASLSNIINFLAGEYQQGKQYRTLNVYRSAISMTHPVIDSHRVGEHPMICQLLKGIFNRYSRPPQPRYSFTWDVSVVVGYIKSLGANSTLSLKVLSQKLAMLLALTSAERSSELAAHDLRFRRFYPEGVVFNLPCLTKSVRSGKNLKQSSHASFPEDKNLCVVECLREYEACTKDMRPVIAGQENKLFLSIVQPHKPVSSGTVARWVRSLLQAAGIDTAQFKPHSVRGPRRLLPPEVV